MKFKPGDKVFFNHKRYPSNKQMKQGVMYTVTEHNEDRTRIEENDWPFMPNAFLLVVLGPEIPRPEIPETVVKNGEIL